jgi:hypothetical protein
MMNSFYTLILFEYLVFNLEFSQVLDTTNFMEYLLYA